MDLSKFSENTLLVAALKSEIDSKELYQHTANRVNNALLKDKLIFLASEEVKHRNIIEGIYKEKFPNEELQIPEKSPVPMPELIITIDFHGNKRTPKFQHFLSRIFLYQ